MTIPDPSAADGPVLARLDRVTKTFSNGIVALRDVSLDIRRGECLSLLGPSGCGKSTALRLIGGLSEPSAGTVQRPQPLARGSIGVVFQDPTLMPWATVFDNVRLPLRLAGTSRRASREPVMQALADIGLADRADAYPRDLSGGMRMRVSIARALITRPALLLLDEPFAALDEINRFRLNDDLLRLKAQFGWTVVFVTHSVFESVYLSDRIAVMTPGPGRIAGIRSIEAPGGRGPAFRMSPAYAEQCRAVSALLHGAGHD